jgi:LysR family transcriptional regulator, transcriptional activator of nhaA
MRWLNYHHLFYFWTVVRTGSIASACKELHLAQPTISGQLRQLEETLGGKLLTRAGRRLMPTKLGQLVYSYADEIFSLGQRLLDAVDGRVEAQQIRLNVGISDIVPKLVAYRFLCPALELKEAVRLVCHEDSPEKLLQQLSAHELDLVLTDAPVNSGDVRVRVYNHPLGSSPVMCFASRDLARQYRRTFPDNLDGAPFLLPTASAALRRLLDHWFERRKIRPIIVGEFQDSSLLAAFGQGGSGLFAAPAAIAKEVRAHYKVETVGTFDAIRHDFFAISAERKLKHAAVAALTETAREKLFGDAGTSA